MSLRLKFTYAAQSAVVSLPRDATWSIAHEAVLEKLPGLPPLSALKAKSGFPPKAREIDPSSALIASGITNGTSVGLSLGAAEGQVTSTTAAAAAESSPRQSVSPRGIDATASPTADTEQHSISTSEWSCATCTLLNGPSAEACAVCGAARPRPGPSGSGGSSTGADSSHLSMERHVVPADNNCLYTAVAWLRGGADDKGASMRQAAAAQLLLRGNSIPPAMLDGMSPKTYSQRILQQDSSWGGAFELQLLAAHFETTFVLLNIQTGKQMQFSADGLPAPAGSSAALGHDGNMSFLLYDGLHFDAVAAAAGPGGDRRSFPVDDPRATAGAQALVDAQRSQRAFTDTAHYTLRCLVCQKGLTGNTEAVAHAQATGHANFAEYS